MKTNALMRLALFLLVISFIFPLSACNQDTKDGTDQTTQTSTSQSTVDEDPYTYNGYQMLVPEHLYSSQELSLLCWNNATKYSDAFYIASDLINENSSIVEIAVAERAENLQESFGLVLTLTTEDDYKKVDTYMNTAALAGDGAHDIVATHGRYSMGYALKGYSKDWNSLKYVELEKPWWNQDARAAFTAVNGKLYNMIGDINYFSIGNGIGLFFNRQLVGDVTDLESPYKLVNEDKWTFEKFDQYVRLLDSALNGDGSGILGQDKFGYATGWWHGPIEVVYAAGYRVAEKKDDKIVSNMCNNITITAFDDFKTLAAESGCCYIDLKDDYSDLLNAFAANTVAFYDDMIDKARTFLSSSNMDYGILPWPKYDEYTDGYHTFVDAQVVLLNVPKTYTEDRCDKISAGLEALAFYGSKDVMPKYYDSALSYQYLHNEEDIAMLKLIRQGLVYDLGYYIQSGSIGSCGQILASENFRKSFKTVYDGQKDNAFAVYKTWEELE